MSAHFEVGADKVPINNGSLGNFLPHHNKRAKLSNHHIGNNLNTDVFGNLQTGYENVIDDNFHPIYPEYNRVVGGFLPQTPQLLAGAYSHIDNQRIFPVATENFNSPQKNWYIWRISEYASVVLVR